MQREPVESSDIKSVGYDEETGEMEVEFHSGGVYLGEVPVSVYHGLMDSDSKGKYWHRKIRGVWTFRKVN